MIPTEKRSGPVIPGRSARGDSDRCREHLQRFTVRPIIWEDAAARRRWFIPTDPADAADAADAANTSSGKQPGRWVRACRPFAFSAGSFALGKSLSKIRA